MEYCPSTFNSQIKETTYNSGNLNLAVKSHYSSVNNTKKAYCEYRCVINIFTGRFEDLVSKETKNKLSGLETRDTCAPVIFALRRPHAVEKFTAYAEIYLAVWCREALRSPPAFHELGLRPCLPHPLAWGVEDAGNE
jgi:hypothetical protein